MPSATTTPRVLTFYRNNISAEMLTWQKRVFDHFEIPLVQQCEDSLSHAQWLDRVFRSEPDELVVVADIDAFPLSRAGFDTLIAKARAGAVAGLAQVANHKDPQRLYAGPMFMALSRALYHDLGAPPMAQTDQSDVAQLLSDRAMQQGKPLSLVYPRFAIKPKWPLADKGVFGIGTFYGELEFFHLFQSRKSNAALLFTAVAQDVVAGRLDFAAYLNIMRPRFPFFGA